MKKIFSYLTILITTIVFVILLNNNTVMAMDIIPKGPHPKLMEKLTEKQQTEIKYKMRELRESGASREEIYTEVTNMLKEYGVEVPDDIKGLRAEKDPRPGRGFMHFLDELTEEQRKVF